MGCAPFESGGVMRMGARWKSAKPSLSAAEWEEFGYCPRRRSIAFVFGENLVKQNTIAGDVNFETAAASASVGNGGRGGEATDETETREAGPSRLRYDQTKAAKMALEDDEWPKIRCHRHGMLLAVKLLLRELWKTWNPGLVRNQEW